MNVFEIVGMFLAVLVSILLYLVMVAERRVSLMRTQISLEKKDIEHREQAGEVTVVDTVRLDSSLERVDFWGRTSVKHLMRGVKI